MNYFYEKGGFYYELIFWSAFGTSHFKRKSYNSKGNENPDIKPNILPFSNISGLQFGTLNRNKSRFLFVSNYSSINGYYRFTNKYQIMIY